jgi:Sulfotransferase family
MTDSRRPVLLVGCPRSGTTLLSVILHAHPRIAMPPETRFLLRIYRRRNSFGDLQVRSNRRRLANRITARNTHFANLGLDRRRVVRAIVNGPPTVGSAMAIVWREFARSRGKVRWGEKRPAYWRHLDAVLRLFPDAQVIHLVRDPRACVASLQKVPWWSGGFLGATATWALADQQLRHFGRHAEHGRYHRLRYEDLLRDPRSELTELCRFLEEDFDERMLEFTGAADDIVPQDNAWHERTRRGLDESRIESWRTSLAPEQIGLIEAELGRAMGRYGYQPSRLGGRADLRARAAYRAELARRYGAMRKAHLLDRLERRKELQPVAADPVAVRV